MTSPQPKVYLAGPGVFMPNAKAIGQELKSLCAGLGLEGLWPADHDFPGLPPLRRAQAIFDANRNMILNCEAVIADLSPFRGPHLDCGTAWEIGYASALGRPVFGYVAGKTSFKMEQAQLRLTQLIDRIICEESPSGWRDAHGFLVEDFGLVDNLMIAMAVRPMVASSAQVAIARCAMALRRPKVAP